MNDRITLAVDASVCVVGGSQVISLQAGTVVSGSNEVYVVTKPSQHAGMFVRIPNEVLSEVKCETKQESARQVLEILESEIMFSSLPQIESDASKHILDLGNETKWPFLNDHKWLHRLNIKIRHPSVTIETLKMDDGKHLVVVLNHSW